MKYKVEFQYKSASDMRPEDCCLNEGDIGSEDGQAVPIPDAGDSVSLQVDGKYQDYRVLTRHFTYWEGWCAITLVVSDIDAAEMAARSKM